ncbi:MAG TPA: ATP-binding protein, partial [Ktedonobacteraceae bacterium]|nr:ATP-binding protein [Ktedonobacteraceae bacterium]
ENLGAIADRMLSRLLVLCSAQRGAIFLGVDERLQPELNVSNQKVLRTLAQQGVEEETAHALLSALPVDASNMKSESDLVCWLTYRLALGEFFLEKEQFSDSLYHSQYIEELPYEDTLLPQVRHPLVALLVIGWTANDDSECASLVERGRRLLPSVIDAIGAVIVGILQVERIHELEATRIRDSLREMELLKAELLGTVSHELRSPLASIKGYAATLLRHERRISREERHQFLLAINEASDRLEIIIQRLLEVSQLETGEVTIDLSPVDMVYLTKEAIAAIEERVSEKQPGRFLFKLLLEQADGTPATSVPLVLADQRRLREVMDNLLENAVKFSPGGGVIKVILHPLTQVQATPAESTRDNHHPMHISRQMLEILVCDNGMGIPVDHLDRIFDRFHRVDTRLTREVSGLGLGLTICKRIVEMHDGVIWAENGQNGKGSVFHIRLPIGNIPGM